MVNHYIVTCGISQLQIARRKGLLREPPVLEQSNVEPGQSTVREGDDPFYTTLLSNKDKLNHERLNSLAQVACQAPLVDKLADQWVELDAMVGTDRNSFGAEISTLYEMSRPQRDHPERAPWFDREQDEITLLHSDTEAGAFCAYMLQALLQHPKAWSMQGRVDVLWVAGLSEKTDNPTGAEKQLAAIIRHIVATQEEAHHTCGLVMTAGYKSTVPIMTLIALVKGLPLFYLFEQSTCLRRIDFPVRTGMGQYILSAFRGNADPAIWIALKEQPPGSGDMIVL